MDIQSQDPPCPRKSRSSVRLTRQMRSEAVLLDTTVARLQMQFNCKTVTFLAFVSCFFAKNQLSKNSFLSGDFDVLYSTLLEILPCIMDSMKGKERARMVRPTERSRCRAAIRLRVCISDALPPSLSIPLPRPLAKRACFPYLISRGK